ncbi:hypothetical protein ILUMI_07625 [Ignelater luminosus]|uniref:NADP-dependent oxidoreductase domain-containing protein n=1 Tax=Ignelater luminosus TaxID=2038154 RepID=A0A8K0D3I9_IGNLU|nr:hypothetical protein ILUMI_07625 [Ignelater luminosus]
MWKVPTFKLLSGHTIPLVGFGSYLIDGERQTKEVLDKALSAGYRLIDTAAMYGNEQDIGLALKELLPKHNLKREDVFITSKLYPSDHGDQAKNALAESLRKLQSGYIDLYLIHWPGVYGISSRSSENAKLRAASWASLVKAKKEGLVRDIGVSNYTVRHLKELLDNCCGVKPVVNQVEWHPGCHQADLKEFCEREGILLQAYMSLGGSGNKSLLGEPFVVKVAEKLGKQPAQVLLRWSVQQNVAVIPKSRSKEHMEANINLDFVIPDEDMVLLGRRKQEKFDWDPNSVK